MSVRHEVAPTQKRLADSVAASAFIGRVGQSRYALSGFRNCDSDEVGVTMAPGHFRLKCQDGQTLAVSLWSFVRQESVSQCQVSERSMSMKTKKRRCLETLALGVRAFRCCLYLCNVDMSVTDAATTMIARFLPIVISIGCHSETNDDNVNRLCEISEWTYH